MIKHYKKMLTVLMLFIASSSVFAQHDAGDIAALQGIIASNFSPSTTLNWGTESDPDLWDGVTWDASSPQRVIVLDLACLSCGNNNTGKEPALQGNLDFTSLDELQELYLYQNTGINSVNISGLQNLTEIHLPRTNVVSINASNCPALGELRAKKCGNLTSINFTGTTNIARLRLAQTSLPSLSFNAFPLLYQVGARNGALTSATFTNCPLLRRFNVGENTGLTSLNVTGSNAALQRIDADQTSLTDVVGLDATFTLLSTLDLDNDKLPFAKAVQYRAMFGFASLNNQPLLPGTTIANGGTANYSTFASVTVSGTPVTTNFDLYDASNALVSSNTTGLFTISTDGGYYITATNSGYSRNSAPIIVGAGVTIDPSFSNADYLILMGFKANNFTTSDFNWGGVSDLSQMTGVTWDNGTPRRVTGLRLSKSNKNQGNAGPTIEISGTMDFTGLTMLDELYLVGQTAVTSINVSGLSSLSSLFVSKSGITSLNASNLSDLNNVYAAGNFITSVDISNNPSINTFRANKTTALTTINTTSSTISNFTLRDGTSLSSLDLSGDAIGSVDISGSEINTLDVSSCLSLGSINARRSGLETLNANGCTSLSYIYAGNCSLTSVDVTGATNLYEIRVGSSNLTNVTGALALTTLSKFRAKENKMLLSVAAPFYNMPSLSNRNFLNQRPYSDIIVDLNDNVDYSNQASITINGTPVTSTFNLYDNTNALISTNSTGIFTMSTVGDFYVEMTNSSVTVRTGNIAVVDIATQPVISASLDNSDFGTTSVGTSVTRTLTINNTGGATLTVSNIIMPSGFTLTGSVTTIAANSSATLTVTFTPSTAMTYNGNILIISDAAAGSGQVSLTGVGSPVSGVYTKKESFLSFYPNPTSDKMLVKQTNTNVNVLYIYSMEGVLVQMVDLGQSSIVDVQALPKGVYVVKSEDGTITERFVKL